MKTNQSITIVICKYNFRPESNLEMKASENESFQLLKDAGDGWLLAKPISRLGNPGLIPRSFCTLRRVSCTKAGKSALEIDGAEITSVCVKSVSSHENRLWYGIELMMTTGKVRYLSRYYQDFYSLQLSLLDALVSNLPRLPGPTTQMEPGKALETRRHDLNAYLGELFNLALTSETVKVDLEKWLKMEPDDVEVEETKTLKEISLILKPKITVLPSNIVKTLRLQVPELDSSASSTPASSPLLHQAPLLKTLPFAPTKPVFEEEKIRVKVIHGDDAFIFKIAANSSVNNLKMAISKQINVYKFKLSFGSADGQASAGSKLSNLAHNGKLVTTVVERCQDNH